MFDIFLSSNEQAKLNLVKYLHFLNFTCSIEQAANYLGVSNRTIERYVDDLIGDFEGVFADQGVTIQKNLGMIEIDFERDISINHLVDRLRLTYIEHSAEFELIEVLLTKKYTSVLDLADDLYQSSSAIYKLLDRIKPLFQAFDIKLSFTTKDDLNIIYDEQNIRFFLYYFYWVTLKGIEQPFPERLAIINERLTGQQVDLLPSKVKQRDYLSAITFTRMIEDNAFVVLNQDTRSILQAFYQQQDLSAPYEQSFAAIPEDNRLDEVLFFNFLLRAVISELDDDPQKMLIVAELKKLDAPIIQYITELLAAASKEFDLFLPIEEEDIFTYYVTIFFLFVFLFEISPPMHLFKATFAGSNPIDPELEKHILAFYHEFLAEHPLDLTINHDYFIVIGVNYLLSFGRPNPVKIAIQFSRNIIGEATVKERLKFMFNPHLLAFTNDYHSADVIISDSFEVDDAPETQHIFIEQLTDELIWGKLYELVQHKIFLKNTHGVDDTSSLKMRKK